MTVSSLLKKKSKVEIKSDVAVNLSRKRLPSARSPCKRKSWFDHNVIIRSYVYASSVVHATEIHLRSLIGARTCMRVYTNSAELDAQSERGISKSSAEKIYMRIALQKSSTCADRLLDNHVVISEYRKFCYWKSLRSLVRKWVSER